MKLLIPNLYQFHTLLCKGAIDMSRYKIKETIFEGLGACDAKSILFDVSDEELLQAFMPKDAACSLIAEYGSVYEIVMHASLDEVSSIAGIGKSKIQKIECLRELIRRMYHAKMGNITAIRSPKDIFEYMADMQHLKQEQFRIIILNTKNKVIRQKIISQGTINMAVVSPREIFNAAIKTMAASIVLVHNHPSGDPSPSSEDKQLTEVIIKAGNIIGISVIDHIIIGKNHYCSFKEKGWI